MREAYDAIVIGSGAAGAVVAAELSEQGRRVLVLEEGPRATDADRKADVGHAVRKFYRNAGALVSLGNPPLTIQVGRAVGGSTLVNGGTCFRTPSSVLEAWSQHTRGAFVAKDLDPYFERIERELHVAAVPEALAFAGERMILQAAHARGDFGAYVSRNALDCQGAQACAFVCPTHAKQSVELGIIPRAERAGATLLADTHVERILLKDKRVTGVRARRDNETFEAHAPLVALCAGALHSPGLLQRSLGSLAPHAAGRSLFLHPGAHVIGFMKDPFESRTGPIQSIYITGPDHRYVIYGMNYPPEILGVFALRPGADLSNLARHRHAITLAVMGSDHGSRGSLQRSPWPDQPVPVYSLDRTDADSVMQGIAHAADLLLDVGATDIYVSIRGVSPLRTRADVQQLRQGAVRHDKLVLGSVHPMGTLPMGVDPRTSVVDPQLAVHGVEGLYVPDASFFPSSLGVNPQITIMAFALRAAERMH